MLPMLLAAVAACASGAWPAPALVPDKVASPAIATDSGRAAAKPAPAGVASAANRTAPGVGDVAIAGTTGAVELTAPTDPAGDGASTAHAGVCATGEAPVAAAADIARATSGVPCLVTRFAPPLAADTPVRRPRAVEHSDAYYTRLTIHRIGSYVILPLFAAEYVVGQKLLNQEPTPGGLKGLHTGLALGVVGVFGLNTITGAWNLWDARHDEEGRTRRTLHALTMLAADGGFAATALIRPHRQRVFTPGGVIRTFDTARARTHKDIAMGSISLATVSTVMMWLWK